jgi:hypothetical protein
MAKYRKIDEAISRRSLNWLENYLMDSIEQDYEKIMNGEVSLLSICKDAVEYSKYNHIYFNTREDREQIYQMARECLSRVEDYMAEQKGFADDDDEDEFPSYANESRKIRISEGQLKQMISESVKRVINEIGDTLQGYETIKKAATKAHQMGRPGMENRFREYGNKLDSGIIKDMSDHHIVYYNVFGKEITIEKNGTLLKDGNFTNKLSSISPTTQLIKTNSAKSARLIAKWIKDKVYGGNEYGLATDWHTYAAQ